MLTVEQHLNYDLFAEIYNKTQGPEECERQLPIIEKLLKQHHSQPLKILDLCCGTGQMVQKLLKKGYQVTGIDLSEGMLQYARQNAPTGKFIRDDARLFKIPSTFDAVISPTGSLNHMMSFQDLKLVFQNVHNALQQNGIFILGLCQEETYSSYNGEVTMGDLQDDYAWVSRDNYDSNKKIAEFKITAFQLIEENWKRTDISHLVKPYSQTEVLATLEDVGFKEVIVYDEEGNLADLEYKNYALFVARKLER
jgi:SAM-dependent methyltransferase